MLVGLQFSTGASSTFRIDYIIDCIGCFIAACSFLLDLVAEIYQQRLLYGISYSFKLDNYLTNI